MSGSALDRMDPVWRHRTERDIVEQAERGASVDKIAKRLLRDVEFEHMGRDEVDKMIVSALERCQLANQPDRVECVACGGSGAASRGGECRACKGTGSALQPGTGGESESAEHYYTPTLYVEAARHVLGGIDLDPASCSLANEVIKAEAFYGPGGLGPDGLVEPWCGRVFLNPPGGRVPEAYRGCGTQSNAALWWATLAEAWRTGEVEAAIFVGFTLEILRSAQALDVLQPIDFPLCVPKNRIAFDIVEGGKRVGSLQPTRANVIVFLPPCNGDRTDRPTVVGAEHVGAFFEAFGPFGKVRA